MNIAYIFFLICCFINGTMLTHNGLSFASWEYWVCLLLPIATFTFGRMYGEE